MDVKKLGRLRDGGGHRIHGRDSLQHRRRDREHGPGYDFIHAAIDDHSRLAYAEVLADERGDTGDSFSAEPERSSPPTASASSGC